MLLNAEYSLSVGLRSNTTSTSPLDVAPYVCTTQKKAVTKAG